MFENNPELYARATKAKASVAVMLDHMKPTSDINSVVDDIIAEFTPNEKLVIACGMFTNGSDGNVRFRMPATVAVMKFMEKNTERYESGYARISYIDDVVVDEAKRTKLTTILRYEHRPMTEDTDEDEV